MPIDYKKYPADWKLRSYFIRYYRSRNRCEWCGAKNHEKHPQTGSMVILTVAHIHDRNPMNASLLNLAALCQKCHLAHDAEERAISRRMAIVNRMKLRQLPFEFPELILEKRGRERYIYKCSLHSVSQDIPREVKDGE